MKFTKILSLCAVIVIVSGFSFRAEAQWLPSVVIDPDPLVFSDTRVNEDSSDMTVTISNDGGTLPLYIFSVNISDPDIFVIVHDGCSGQTIYEYDSCSLDIQFSPIANSHYSASLSVVGISRTVVNSSIVEGRGVEPLVVLSSSSINFGDQTINKAGIPREVLMTNSGSSELSITEITASGEFSVTDDCGDALAALASCSLEIYFEPTQEGDLTGSVTITDDASDSPQSIAMSGKGVAKGEEDAGLSSDSVEFAPIVVGQTSAATEITLTSTGTVALTGINISINGNFEVSADCGNPLASGESCTLSITFTPPSAADFSGSVTIESGATDSPQSISLSGMGVSDTGPQVSLSVNSLDFGEQVVKTESDARAITVTNSGTEALDIDEVALGGDSAHSYNEHDNCHEATIASGQSCTISVAFTPASDGTMTATLGITDNSGSSPQSISLTGIGIAATSSSGSCSLIAGGGIAPWSMLVSLSMALAGLVGVRRFRKK